MPVPEAIHEYPSILRRGEIVQPNIDDPAHRFRPEDLLFAIIDDGSDRIENCELASGDCISLKKEHAGLLAAELNLYAR